MGIIIILIVTMIILVTCIKIVPESFEYTVETLGKYRKTLKSGLNFLIPFIDRVSKIVSLKEQVIDFPPQPVITKDNATVEIDTVIYFQILDTKLYTYGVERPIKAIENLATTTLRNIIGDLTVDQTLTSREKINTEMRIALDEATDAWGIKVNRVELKSILPPIDMRQSMEKEMKAERDKRAKILTAQAERESSILIAEGEKQAAILRAEARKEQQIREAEGEAQAILSVQKAKSEAIKLLNESKPSPEIIAIKGLEALEKVADGKATKIIIPSNLQGLAGMVTSFAELNEKYVEPVKEVKKDYNMFQSI